MKKIGLLLICWLAATGLFAQDFALKQLESSPRHHEWVKVANGSRQVDCFVVYPEVSGKVPVVVLIHENRGMTDWVRSMADLVAEAGFIAIAPDLLSGMGPDGGNTATFANGDDARKAIYELKPEQVTADLVAISEYGKKIAASNGKVAVGGFCWGGAQTFRFATNYKGAQAFLVFYGTGPEDAAVFKNIKAPVYGFYGGDDNRVNATIPASEKFMKAAKKKYEPVIYEGAGHGFMRSGQDPAGSEANKKARDAGFERMRQILSKM